MQESVRIGREDRYGVSNYPILLRSGILSRASSAGLLNLLFSVIPGRNYYKYIRLSRMYFFSVISSVLPSIVSSRDYLIL